MASILDALDSFRALAPQQVLRLGDAEWRLRELGQGGTPLLLLPGAMGTADVFCRTALDLHGALRCITVTPPAWADVVRMADALAALLDRLALAQAHLLGSSISGYLLQVFAARHPQRVASLFLANTFADAALIQARLPSPEELARMPAGQVLREVPARLVPEALRAPPHPDLAALMGRLVGSEQSADTLKARLLMLALAEPAPPLMLAAQRIVLIDDASDPIIPHDTREQLRARHPQSACHAVPGGGHYPMVLQPAVYAAILRQHLLPV